MSPGRWMLYLALTLAAAAFVLWLYFRREPPGRGRLVLTALRSAAFALVLLLLFDPSLPGVGTPARSSRVQVLLDASASMGLPARPAGEVTRWAEAVAEARRRGGTATLFGEAARPVASEALPDSAPGDARSLLLPALRAAAESGAGRVVVVTDGALEDAALLGGWLARLGLGVEWVRIGAPLTGVGITEVSAPGWAPAGEPVELELTLVATGAVSDSVHVVVRQAGRAIGAGTVAAPPPGRAARVRLPVRPAGRAEGGFVQLEVALEPGDVVPADDRRTVSMFVSAEPAGVVLISLLPDQEPRFLLPVLGRALGLPTRGFLRTGEGGWIRLGDGREAGRSVPEGEVARAAGRADLLVLHGAGAEPPPWVVEAAREATRLLVLGASPAGTLPVQAGEPVSADWFVAPDLPASPVAALLTGIDPRAVPPLAALRPATAPEAAWTPLRVTRGRAGQSAPLLLAGEEGGRRWAVAVGEGYWRWAFRGGESRQLYERLWAAVGGWLTREQAGGGGGVRPVRRVVSRGEPSGWVAPGLRLDSLRLRLTGGAARLDTLLRPTLGDTLFAPALPPGTYRYDASAFGAERSAQAAGELVVEAFSPEFARPVVSLADVEAPERVGEAAATAPARALHTAWWPYLLIVLLLGAEWILRRRWGLR